jgi:ATP-dependent Clp protease ATP-binding subunit ClpC
MPSPKPGLASRAGWRVRTQLAALSPARRHTPGIHTRAAGFLPFTAPVRHAVGFAMQEADRLGHAHWGPGHLLLGLISQDDGIAARVLERLGISHEHVRQQARQAVTASRPQPGRPPHPHPHGMIQAMVAEATAHCDRHIGTGHLLLALFRADDQTAARALARLGAGEDEVRRAITALRAEAGRERPA